MWLIPCLWCSYKQSLFQEHFPYQDLYHLPCISQKLWILVLLLCEHHDQKQLGNNEVYFAYTFISQFHYQRSLGQNSSSRASTWGRAETEAWMGLLTGLSSRLVHSAFLQHQDLQLRDDTAHRQLSSQSLPCRPIHSPILWWQFFNWESLLLDDIKLAQS